MGGSIRLIRAIPIDNATKPENTMGNLPSAAAGPHISGKPRLN
jgi:hypothetical protein